MKSAKIFVYSETGFTRTYGNWISEETGIAIEELGGASSAQAAVSDVLILGAPIHGSELVKKRLLHQCALAGIEAGAHVIVFATGITPPDDSYTDLVRKESGLADLPLSFYYLPGGFDKKRLPQSSKTLIFLYRLMMSRQRGQEEQMEILLERTNRACDLTDKGFIAPVVMEAKSYLASGSKH